MVRPFIFFQAIFSMNIAIRQFLVKLMKDFLPLRGHCVLHKAIVDITFRQLSRNIAGDCLGEHTIQYTHYGELQSSCIALTKKHKFYFNFLRFNLLSFLIPKYSLYSNNYGLCKLKTGYRKRNLMICASLSSML